MEALHIALKACIALLLKLMNIAVHGVGYYLLRAVQKESRLQMVQMVYIANLSIIELLINLLSFVRNLLKITGLQIFKSKEFKMLLTYSYILDYAVLKFCLYMTMITLTLDRLFLITLNVNYSKHCNAKKARYVVRLTWLSGVLLFILTSCVYSVHASQSRKSYLNTNTMRSNTTLYNWTRNEGNVTVSGGSSSGKLFFVINFVTLTFDVIFLGSAVVSYALIFHVYKRRQRKNALRKQTSLSTQGVEVKLSLWKTFRQSRFYVSLLLILTFVVFVIPADIAWTVYSLKKTNRLIETVTTISYAISYLSDGLIYIFMNPKVKELLVRKLRRLKILKENVEKRRGSSFYETEQTVGVACCVGGDDSTRHMSPTYDVNANSTTTCRVTSAMASDICSTDVKADMGDLVGEDNDEVFEPLIVGEFNVTIVPRSDVVVTSFPTGATVGQVTDVVLYSKCPLKDCPFMRT